MRVEIRNNNEAVIEGYVNAVCRDSRKLPSATGAFVEQVESGVFKRALELAEDVEVRLNHEKVLGSIKKGNLELYEDNIGLYAKATVQDEELITRAKRGELRGWSFGFVKLKDRWETDKDGSQRRFLEEIELREVSILTITPAYIATSIEMRGEEALICEERNQTEELELVDYSSKSNYDYYNKYVELLKCGGKC